MTWLQGELIDSRVWIKCEADGSIFQDDTGQAHVRYHVNPAARVFPAPVDALRVSEKQAPVVPAPPPSESQTPEQQRNWYARMSQIPDSFFDDLDSDDERDISAENAARAASIATLAGDGQRSSHAGGGGDEDDEGLDETRASAPPPDDGLEGPAGDEEANVHVPTSVTPASLPPRTKPPSRVSSPSSSLTSLGRPPAGPRVSPSQPIAPGKAPPPRAPAKVAATTTATASSPAPAKSTTLASVLAPKPFVTDRVAPAPVRPGVAAADPRKRKLDAISGPNVAVAPASRHDPQRRLDASSPVSTRPLASVRTTAPVGASAAPPRISNPPTRPSAAAVPQLFPLGRGAGKPPPSQHVTPSFSRGVPPPVVAQRAPTLSAPAPKRATAQQVPSLDIGALLAARMAPKTGGYGGCGGGGAAFGQGKNEKQKTSAEQHQADTRELIRSLPVNAIVCFTDGSSKGNPGPAGAGAVVCFPSLPPDSGGEGGGGGSGGDGDEDQDLARLSGRMELLAIAQVGDARCGTWMEGVTALGRQTNNVAELEAVRLANSIAVEARAVAAYYARCPIHIITDSIYARGVVMGTMRAAKNQELVRAAGGEIADSQADVHWCKGHAGIPGNERADRLADLGADKSARSSKVERVVATVGARR